MSEMNNKRPKLDEHDAGNEDMLILMQQSPLYELHAALIERIVAAISLLRQHCQSTPELLRIWQRLDKGGRLVKEVNEAIPTIAWAVEHMEASTCAKGKWTVVDLCSGVGYLGVVLAALLDPEKVARIVLVDKQWPLLGHETLSHHINPDHINGLKHRIDLCYRKYDIKAGSGQRQFKEHIVDRAPGPIMLLGIHLCGTLSLKAIETFNSHPECQFLALKPCCLPVEHGRTQNNRASRSGRRETIWRIGGAQMSSADVAGEGKYIKGKWNGPPKVELSLKFESWTEGLLRSIWVGGACGVGHKEILDVHVGSPQRQEETGHHYQTKFLFAVKPWGLVCPAEMALETETLEPEPPPDKEQTKAAAKARRLGRVQARQAEEAAALKAPVGGAAGSCNI